MGDNREKLVCKRRHYLDGGDKLSSPEEKGKGKRKKLKNGRYSDDDDDDVSLDPQLSQCKKKKRKNTGLNVLMELEKQVLPDVLQKMEEFLRSAPRPTTTPIPTPRPRPEPTLSPAPTAVPAPATEDPSPAPGPSSASATEALGHSVIPKGLVERCSFQSPQKFINDLLHGMYTREYMAGHSVTGQSSSSCTEGKPGLAKQDLVEITTVLMLFIRTSVSEEVCC
ncbi:unnamed protein product [Arctogadus glacialis]